MITRYITFAAVVFLSGTLTTVAQSKPSYNGTIKVAPVRVLQSGETLHVEMEFILNHVKVRSAGAVDLIPRLVSSTDTLELPRVSLKGRNEYSNYERVPVSYTHLTLPTN